MPAIQHSIRLFALPLAAVASLLVWAATSAACETPVYRYAMYRWAPAPYEVYFLHDQPPDESAQRIADLAADYVEGKRRANLIYLPVNLADDPELNSVPPDVKAAWSEREDHSLPAYLVSSPYGIQIFSGALDEEALQALVESPARRELAAQLEAGKIGVFVLLTGARAEENEAAEQLLQQLCQEVSQGKVSLYVAPAELAAAGEEAADGDEPNHEVGLIKLPRDSQEEQWFVRTLLAMEPDLSEDQRPMVFLVYGRARALLPYIGAGITHENLIREVEFISGACSCTVKEQNPGMDLLVRHDWEAAAAAVAEKFGAEEGNESRFGVDMFIPELIIPRSNPAVPGELASASQDPQPPAESGEVTQSVAPEQPASGATEADTQETVAAAEEPAAPPPQAPAADDEKDLLADRDQIEVAAANSTAGEDQQLFEESSSTGLGAILMVGAGVAVALIVLFGLTFFVLRPQ